MFWLFQPIRRFFQMSRLFRSTQGRAVFRRHTKCIRKPIGQFLSTLRGSKAVPLHPARESADFATSPVICRLEQPRVGLLPEWFPGRENQAGRFFRGPPPKVQYPGVSSNLHYPDREPVRLHRLQPELVRLCRREGQPANPGLALLQRQIYQDLPANPVFHWKRPNRERRGKQAACFYLETVPPGVLPQEGGCLRARNATRWGAHAPVPRYFFWWEILPGGWGFPRRGWLFRIR